MAGMAIIILQNGRANDYHLYLYNYRDRGNAVLLFYYTINSVRIRKFHKFFTNHAPLLQVILVLLVGWQVLVNGPSNTSAINNSVFLYNPRVF